MYPRIPVLASAEAAEIPAAEPRLRGKACEEYSAMGHTRLAPIALRTNATFIMLKSAKKRSAYGKKQRRTMNSVCRATYKNGFDGRLSAWACQIFNSCSGRLAARRWRSHPVARKLAIAPNSSMPPHSTYILAPELLHRPTVIPTKRHR